jgi:hypothetical protein
MPADSIILSACADSIILSAGGTKQQLTKSCSRKCGNDGGGRDDSCCGDGFDVGSRGDNCSNNSNSNSNCNGDGDSIDSDSGNDNSNSNSGSGDSDSGVKNINRLKTAVKKATMAVDAALASILLPLSVATSVQGSAESIIPSVHVESIILSAPPTESIILSAPPTESIILSACTESIILSAGGAKQ